ncbi:pimeloyl-ACP methyl ester carboxylesterase [Actinoplanes tereljensis]|uniref:Alpha/beta hydrolase n=1 Tax=Paractinoplanes tereljensis TaxID=571912 RepID=A0A919NWL3_9ACTN|nr:alpha/beta hydrolase [Actinoplanes tereljensis]GIF26063.1 alpha/beta hydrolase [Actinoplanes tereljensis]
MVTEVDVRASDGRTLHTYSRGDGDRVVMWHHGTPNIGSPPAPLFAAADRLGIRFIGYDRPGYGGSTPRPGRDIASAAGDAEAVADALGVGEFAVFGHSGGGPCALACAALLPGRVTAAVSISGLAPYDAADLDWFAGTGPAGQAGLRAATAGRAAKELHEKANTDTAPDFQPADWAALEGEWGWFGSVVEPALAAGPAPLIDDDLSYVTPWGFAPASITARVLLAHGTADRVVPPAHSSWLATHIPNATLRLIEDAGHISVLPSTAVPALEWI